MTSPKEYKSLGVQTDPVVAGVLESSTLAVAQNGAYMHSNALSLSNNPRLPGQRHYKYSDLTYNRPSQCSNVNQEARVVSLPETTPLISSKVLAESNRRVVSLTTDASAPCLLSDDLDHSGEFTQSSTSTFGGPLHSGDDSGSLRHFLGNALPRTPSPPSSPDSVTIISHPEGRVPSSFLHNDKDTEGHLRDAEDGWLSWSHSPPRPIPALHGPSSLPYARCPSGAEGTVIEKPAEIPRVIWGLSTNDSDARLRTSGSHNMVNESDNPPNNKAPDLQPTIDLRAPLASRPITTQSSVFRPQNRPHYSTMPSLEVGFGPRDASQMPRHEFYSTEDEEPFEVPRRGDFLDLRESEFVSSGLRLFIPADRLTGRHSVMVPDRAGFLDRTAGHRMEERSRSSPLEPKDGNTSSPSWTPLFSSYLDMFGSPDMPPPRTTPATPRMAPKPLPQILQDPEPTVDTLSDELRRFVLREMGLARTHVHEQVTSARPSLSTYSDDLRHDSNAVAPQSYRNTTTLSPLQPRPPPNSPMTVARLRPVEQDPHSSRLSTVNLAGGHHPRSVPFARLMQRRLSAVPEETGQLATPSRKDAANIQFERRRSPYRSQDRMSQGTDQNKAPWVRTAGDPRTGLIHHQSRGPTNQEALPKPKPATEDAPRTVKETARGESQQRKSKVRKTRSSRK
ncbi:hypothetical protein ONZ45_g19473 [Pleurotus djamor]|nr:hypothetical protein ONZ45_g19473 [Pleurotus djamor]